MVSYSYSDTIGPRTLTFKQCIKDFNIIIFDVVCNCGDSSFKDIDIGHVLTGNLNIIRDRKLIQKGPSYREQSSINWDINFKTYITAVRQYKIKWAKQEIVDTRVLNEWEGTMIYMVRKRIDKIRRKYK